MAALAATLVLAAACSSPQGAQPEDSRLGKGKDRGANGRGGSQGAKSGSRRNASQGAGQAIATPAPGVAVPSPGAGASRVDPSKKTTTEIASQGEDPRTAMVEVTEPDPDAEKSGIAPDYADILSTRVEGAGPDLRVTITMRGDVPQKMPDGQTYMVLGFGVTPPKGQQRGYAFGASADSEGWTAYGGDQKDDRGKFPGDFSLSGAVAVFTIPWSSIKGPRSFEWYSQTSWFKSLAGTTHYSLDALPNEGPAKYPAG